MAGASIMSGITPSAGYDFTATLHHKAEGPTDPARNKHDGPFVVCVTGAGKGLGYHIALSYARAGATGLVISSRTQADLEKLSTELKGINMNLDILAQTTNTQNDKDVKDLAAATRDKFDGRLDVVVANPGVISKYFDDGHLPKGILEDNDFERVIDINFLGTMRVARHFVPLLIASHAAGGVNTLIAITSLAAHMSSSSALPAAYNTSKIAVCRLVEHMDNDHRQKDSLLSYAVHPGAVLTPQTKDHHKSDKDWTHVLSDDIGLAGGWLTWLTKQRRDWLSGRYLSVNWDVAELERMKEFILKDDMLKFRMSVRAEVSLDQTGKLKTGPRGS